VRIKFATPILHAIDNSKDYDIFLCIYITIDNIFLYSLNFLVIFIFCSNYFSLGMLETACFIEKKDPQIWLPFFHYVIDTMYIYSWKNIDKIVTHFGDASYQN